MASSTSFIILQFILATLLPVAISVVLTVLERRTSLGKMSYWPRQVLYGIVFGLVAIYGTEAGITTEDATMNVRDAAPLVAGLYFGGPAGVIAGAIGGVERWFAALWGRGMFTRAGCSIATVLAGVYALLVRRELVEERKPSWGLAFTVGIVVEVLHMLLIFLTNLDQAARAFYVVQACTPPMVSCVALSVGISGIVLALMNGQGIRLRKDIPDISHRVRLGMLQVVLVGFVLSVGFVAMLQTSLYETQTEANLSLEIEDMVDDIQAVSDENLLDLAREAAHAIPSVDSASQETIDGLVESLDLAELHVIDERGIIVASSDPVYLGFDMSSGEQSSEFLTLLPGGGDFQVVQSYQPMTLFPDVWRKFAGVRISGGFLQVGYDAERFVGDLTSRVKSAVANRHVGFGGLFIVLTERYVPVGSRSDVVVSYWDAQWMIPDIESVPQGEVFKVTFHGDPYYAMCRTTEGLRILALLPASEVQLGHDLSVYVTAFMEVIVFAALFVAIYVLIKRVVVESIWQVNGRLGQITNGDLSVEVDVRNSVEFASLSDDINATVLALRNAIAAEGARIERDLATAKAIQESALPQTFPPFPDIDAFDIYALMNAAREVGGDFYDFFLIDDHTLGFLIADVSGKGIPASLFMMAAKSELSNYMISGMDLAEAVRSANWNLCQHNDAGMFVTVWAATLDYRTGRLTYVNAGHNPPLLRHDGAWEWLKQRGGLFLGTFETAKYRSNTITIVPGDQLMLYTDGVNEAFSVEGEEYGNDRLEAFLSAHTDLRPRLLIDMLRADVRQWAEGAEQSDDITMLCLEYGVSPEVANSFSVSMTDEGLDEILHRMHYEFSQFRCPEETQRKIDRTVSTLFANALRNRRPDSEVGGSVSFSYFYDSGASALTMSISDWGEPVDPFGTKGCGDVDMDARLAAAMAAMDDMAYVRDGDCNVVAFRKVW